MSTSFDQTPTQPPETPHPRPLPVPTLVVAGVLLIAPLIALALVGTYASAGPRLWGFPFFYWYQMLWVIITPLFTGLAYFLIKRARGER